MKIKLTFLVLGAMLLAGISHAQDGWKWPADPAQEAKAREFNAAYFDYMKAEQFVEATKPLSWLLVNVPNLNESIYIQGVTVYKKIGVITSVQELELLTEKYLGIKI